MVLRGNLESNPANGMDGSDRLGGAPDRGRGHRWPNEAGDLAAVINSEQVQYEIVYPEFNARARTITELRRL